LGILLENSRLLSQAIEAQHRKRALDAVIFYNDVSGVYLRALRFCRASGILALGDCTEWHSFRLRLLGKAHFWDQAVFRGRFLRSVNALIGISSFWRTVADRVGCEFLRVPSLADPEVEIPLPLRARSRDQAFNLVYIGVCAPREMPEAMVAAVCRARRYGVNARLTIVGGVERYAFGRAFMRRVANSPVAAGLVSFTGRLEPSEFKRHCEDADAFVLLSDGSREAQACFPTRVPELLLSTRPTILSERIDLDGYVEHAVHCWLVSIQQPVSGIAAGLKFFVDNRHKAAEVGLGGRSAGIGAFDYRPNTQRILGFVRRVRSSIH
jgi:glycosyltransferase involved in cell wall biosynthesis